MNNPKPVKFIHFIISRILLMCLIAFSVTTLITGIAAYIISSNTFENHIQQEKTFIEKEIRKKLVVGWVPKDLENILLKLNSQRTHQKYYFIPDSSFGNSQKELLNLQLQNTLNQIEQDDKAVFEKHFSESQVTGGFPIHLENHCMKCHPDRIKGEYAGTVLFSSQMEQVLLNWKNVTFFFLFFFVTFITVGSIVIVRILRNELIHPLTDISDRISHLRLEDTDVQWNREPKHLLEIDQIDEYLYRNISMLKNVHEKLDALFVTEHESGFFHENRFKEALQYETYRADRYEHPFSVLIIKLIKIIKLDDTRSDSTAEKIHIFAKLIRDDIRDSDMPFRIGKQLFVIITPETDENQISKITQDYREKFRPSHSEELNAGYLFEVSAGFATYGYDARNGKELLKIALQRMNDKTKNADADHFE